MKNIWYSLCVLFYIQNLTSILNDCWLISYMVVDQTNELYDNITNYLICTPFDEIKRNDNRPIKPMAKWVFVDQFLNQTIQSIEYRLNESNVFELNRSLVYNRHACYLVDKMDLETSLKISKFIQTYLTSLFIYSNGKQPFFFEMINENVDRSKFFYLRIFKKKVYNAVDNSKCLYFDDQLAVDRLSCLNRCFKKRKAYFSFYRFDDSGSLMLGAIIQSSIKLEDQIPETDKETRKVCLKECTEFASCFSETYGVAHFREQYYERVLNGSSKIVQLQLIVKAFYTTTDFWLQLIGILTLITNTSISNTIPALVHQLALKINFNQNVNFKQFFKKHLRKYFRNFFRKFYPGFKFTILLFSLIFVLNVSKVMIDEFHLKSTYPNQTDILFFEFEIKPFSAIICLPVEIIIHNDSKVEEGRNLEILNRFTFEQIEEQTNFENQSEIVGIYLVRGTRLRTFNWQLSKKVLFKNALFDTKHCLMRCYRLEITTIKELTRYESMMPITNLLVLFRSKFWNFNLLLNEHEFSSGLVNLDSEFYKRTISIQTSSKSMRSPCMKYNEVPTLNCTTKRSCIDRCVNRKFLNKYSSLPMNSAIDKTEFEPYLLSRIKFNESNDPDIEKDCSEQFNKIDCNQVMFLDSNEAIYSYNETRMEVSLYFERVIIKDIEQSALKVLLNILNLESIFFGTNVTSFLLALIHGITKIFKSKWHPTYRALIFLLCLFGFSMHNIFIFKGIVQGEIIDSSYYKRNQTFMLPSTIYCFEFDETRLNPNFLLNRPYLDRLTNNLNFERIFDKVEYVGIQESMVNLKSTNFESDLYRKLDGKSNEIRFSHFYYSGNLKCFEIDLIVQYKEASFYFFPGRNMLHVFFNRTFSNRIRSVLFLYRESGTKQFGKLCNYKIGNRDGRSEMKKSYQISFELIEMERDDKFEIFKNIRTLFAGNADLNDATNYLNSLKDNFASKFGLTTREIILENNDPVMQIDDELFKQFYSQIQDEIDNNLSKNSKRRTFNIFNQKYYSKADSKDFGYTISFFSQQIVSTNDDNYTKIIQGILNALVLWLDICILDLFVYVHRLLLIFEQTRDLLVKLKSYLAFKLIN